MMYFDVGEHHATKRVLRQFHHPQGIPGEPAWVPMHYQRDDRTRVDDKFVRWLEAQVHIWDQREDLIPPPPSQIHEAIIELYMSWYRCHTRLMIGNPIHVLGNRYRPYAGKHETLVSFCGLLISYNCDIALFNQYYKCCASYWTSHVLPVGTGDAAAWRQCCSR